MEDNTKEWLSRTTEEIVEPDLPICDPHHHFWDYPGNRYMLNELLEDTGSGHNIRSTVFVECGSMYRADGPEEMAVIGETEFVQGLAAMSASGAYGDTRVAQGIISHANLLLGRRIEKVLRAHIQASPNRFRGVRHSAAYHPSDAIRKSHSDPPPHMLMTTAFREGLEVVADLNLTLDAWLFHSQLEEFVDLAKAFPGLTLVLDHFGGPLGIGPYTGQSRQVYGDWKKEIVKLADLENVVFKLGGINMPINGFGWDKADAPPGSDQLMAATGHYYRDCIDLFGPKRCMFESNFPVDKRSVSYAVLWNAFKKITAHMNTSDRSALFHDTAVRVYRLDSP
jgi:L-fuconolactonase